MFDFLRAHQLNIMLGMSSICMAVGFFAIMTSVLPKRRKLALADMEFAAAILLFSDRMAYVYHGDVSRIGFWMVRITNFLVFFMTISMLHAFNLYISDLCKNEIGLEKTPFRLRLVEVMCGIGWVLVVVSQFTGLYYTFDETNAYQRGPGFLICYAIPFLALFIQLSVIIQYFKRLSLYIAIPVVLFTVIPILASIVQALNYGLSLTNMSIVGMGIVLYIFAIIEMNSKVAQAQKQELEAARDFSSSVIRSYGETILAISKAVDSRDRYTKEHSRRVAEYSRDIALAMGLSDNVCYEVYFSAILHDIGKIEIPDSIIGKEGRLTPAEEELFKKHTTIGYDILSEVNEIQFLKAAAKYHHERYDGKGYPEGLRGEAIPLSARIVAVANAYDEMTSFKVDRGPMAQEKVREEFVKGSGTAYDPKIASIMVDMIDKDTDYLMRETEEQRVEAADINDIAKVKRMHFVNYKETVSDGIMISKEFLKIRFESCPDAEYDRKIALPAIILFDSFDRAVHRNARTIKNQHYYEYGEIWLDGHTVTTGARDIKVNVRMKEGQDVPGAGEWVAYDIEAVSFRDHVKIKINCSYMAADVTVALPDSTRSVFLGITGEHCSIRNASVREIELTAKEDTIERIAAEANYFTRKEGDVPNVEIDGYRATASEGFPVEDGMRLYFHSMALPTASLVHHCAYLILYTSDDGLFMGKNYSEFACIRLDGDECTQDGKAENKLTVKRSEDFAGWDAWKIMNKRGFDYQVEFRRKRNHISFETENGGISIDCSTVVPAGTDAVYVAVTGDLCAITDIRVR